MRLSVVIAIWPKAWAVCVVSSAFPADDIITALAGVAIGCKHDDIVQPTGSPISVSTQRGLSLPVAACFI